MPVSMKDLGLDQLTVAERISLAEELWDSVSESQGGAVGLTEAHRRDLQLRLEAHRDDPKAGSSWEDVKTRLRGTSR